VGIVAWVRGKREKKEKEEEEWLTWERERKGKREMKKLKRSLPTFVIVVHVGAKIEKKCKRKRMNKLII
jgi:hypothetical protein